MTVCKESLGQGGCHSGWSFSLGKCSGVTWQMPERAQGLEDPLGSPAVVPTGVCGKSRELPGASCLLFHYWAKSVSLLAQGCSGGLALADAGHLLSFSIKLLCVSVLCTVHLVLTSHCPTGDTGFHRPDTWPNTNAYQILFSPPTRRHLPLCWATWSWERGDMGNFQPSSMPLFYYHTKSGTVVSHLALSLLTRVDWWVNSSPDYCLCGETACRDSLRHHLAPQMYLLQYFLHLVFTFFKNIFYYNHTKAIILIILKCRVQKY